MNGDASVACPCHVPVGITGYDVTLPHGTSSAIRRHKAKGEVCGRCGVPQDPPDGAAERAVTAGDRGGRETGMNRSFDDLLHLPSVTVGDGCVGESTSTHAGLANA